jgi:hypothetical protein
MKLVGYRGYGFNDSPKLNYNFKENVLKRNIFLSDEISKYLDVLIEK